MSVMAQHAAQVLRGPTPRRLGPGNTAHTPAGFGLPELAGRLVELSGQGASAALTYAVKLVLDAQARSEPTAWVTSTASVFYPPDLEESGVVLSALVVVRVEHALASRHKRQAVAAERLVRSGAFGLVVVDLGADATLAQPLQTRLLGLAQKHDAVLLCLTEKPPEAPSLGSLVSLHVHASRRWLGADRFECRLDVRKDKQRGPTWSESEVCRGPLGLR
jgi:recombination protein RecA